MRFAVVALVVASAALVFPANASAQGRDPFAADPPRTPAPVEIAPPAADTSFARAHELLVRAKTLDESARNEERAAVELEKKLAPLRAQAAQARNQASTALLADRDGALALAEQLETELAVAELETGSHRKTAADQRKSARDLRERALRIARGEEKPVPVATPTLGPALTPAGLPAGILHCRPPYWCSDDVFRERL